MTLIARFSRAGTDDHTLEVEVEDIVIDFDCVEDATTGRVIATIGEDDTNTVEGEGKLLFLTEENWFDTLTVVQKT